MTDVDTAELRRLAEAATRRPIAEFPGYSVTSTGIVWSDLTNWRGYGPRPVTPVTEDGYERIRLGPERLKRSVHVLVALAFIGPRPTGMQVCHINGQRSDNRVENLRWGTARQNAQDREVHGHTARGPRNGWAHLTADDVREVRVLRDRGLLYREIEAATGVNRYYARSICVRKVWAHVA